ncbi:MAG: hypothetical protein V4754_04065 [Pseudomonadota bacterium]
MSTITTQFASDTQPLRAYAVNVGHAARALLAALLAVNTIPVETAVAAVSSHDTESAFAFGGADALMPNLTTELRFMASRA